MGPEESGGRGGEGDIPDRDDADGSPADGVGIVETELEDGQLAYDCTAWIAHAWQGTMLTVRDEDETAVDDLIDEVLAAARPALDPSAPKLVYEVAQWPVSLQTELVDALTVADLPYEWDQQGDLVVLEDDEDAVSAILEELPDPDEGEISADDGVAVHELFDSLFMAADRLARHPADPSATVSLVDDAEVISQVALPFGFEPAQWRRLVGEVADLRVAIEGEVAPEPVEGEPDDEPVTGPVGPASDERIAELAAALRDHLRQYV